MPIYPRCSSRLCLALLAAALLLPSLASTAAAHELELATARVTLRGTHIEVRVDVDLNRWMANVGDEEGPQDPGVRLLTSTHLDVDGSAQLFETIRVELAPDADHGERVVFVLEAKARRADPAALSVRFPESLGPMIVNFVQPVTAWTAAGSPSNFKVAQRGGGR